jgi:hypothetical protein
MLTLGEISKRLKLSNGGGLKLYLENLEMANFITSYVSWNKPANSKARKYKIQDEYLNFYFHFVAPFKKEIFEKEIPSFFNLVIKPKLIPWMGIAFERYCLKHAMKLAAIMGFADEVINFGPYFEKSDEGFQIDLLFHRADKVITVCEIKFHQDKIDTDVVKQLNDKIRKLAVPVGYSVEKALICLNGATPSLIKSELLDYIVQAEEILK